MAKTMIMAYSVKTDKFEGPLDLLLELIEKEKLDITEFSLAGVADQYLEYIRSEEHIKIGHLAEFLSVASKLILIKSRALLPLLTFTEEEEEEIKDLAKQLEEYKKFKEASVLIGKMSERGSICYARLAYVGIQSVFYPPENLQADDLRTYFQGILKEIPIVEKLEEEVIREVVTLEERINDLQNVLRRKMELSFSEMVSKSVDKVDVIISFLAMLEMVKQKIVEVEQKDLFKEIRVSVKNSGSE